MSENKLSVRLELKNQKIRSEFEQIISAIGDFLIKNQDNKSYCDLLILEIDENISNELDLVRNLKDSGAVREVFLTSAHTEPEVLIKALRSGAKEFFKQPINREEVAASIQNLKEQVKDIKVVPFKTKNGTIITIMGSKGGVGTTTVAVNLAASLKEANNDKSVVLIDMNFNFGEVQVFLDLKTSFNWGELAKNITRVDSTYLMSILKEHSSGIYVLPSPTDFYGVNQATPEIMEQILGLIKKEFDYIVIDNGQSLNLISQKILEISDVIGLVSVMSLPCLRNVSRLSDTFRKFGYVHGDKLRIIMNRYHKNTVLTIDEAEKAIKQKISWLIPNDYNTAMTSINQGKLLSQVSKRADISLSFSELAASILGKKKEVKNQKKSFWRWSAASL